MQFWILLTLLLQTAVIGGLMGFVIALIRRSSAIPLRTSKPPQNKAVSSDAIQQQLTTATRTIEMHSGELSRFERSLAAPSDEAAQAGQLEKAFDDMRRANQKVEETIDSTLASLVGAFREMLNDEKSSLERYRSRTQQFDSELGKMERHSLFASITARVIEMVQELRSENRILRNGLQKAVDKTKELMDRAQAAERLARTDSLTKLPNRRFFDEYHAVEHETFELTGAVYAIILMDLDHFKALNDMHGHHTGDAVLAMVGHVFNETRRSPDYLCRIGGEEFALLLPRCNIATAKLIADRYRQKIELASLQVNANQVQVTISCGIAESRGQDTKSDVLHRADLALYEAKRLGRNRVFADETTIMIPAAAQPLLLEDCVPS